MPPLMGRRFCIGWGSRFAAGIEDRDRDRGAPGGAVASGWWLVPRYKLLDTSY